MANIQVFDSTDEIARAAEEYVLAAARDSIAARGVFNLDLAGGSTPRKLYERLAERTDIDWSKWHLFMGDERFVPLDDERSNMGLVQTALLDKITIPKENVHFVPVGEPTVQAAAQAYEQEIRDHFKTEAGDVPAFDLVLLGMGPDAHTASLFPGKAAVSETQKLVVASEAGLQPFVERVTFTLPLIDAAKRVLFLAAGADKAEAFRTVRQDLDKPPKQAATPAGKVRPSSGELQWFVDRAANAS